MIVCQFYSPLHSNILIADSRHTSMQRYLFALLVLACSQQLWAQPIKQTLLLRNEFIHDAAPCSITNCGLQSSNVMRLRGGMDQMAAYLLCRMGGNDNPTFEDVTKVHNTNNARGTY